MSRSTTVALADKGPFVPVVPRVPASIIVQAPDERVEKHKGRNFLMSCGTKQSVLQLVFMSFNHRCDSAFVVI